MLKKLEEIRDTEKPEVLKDDNNDDEELFNNNEQM